MVRIFAPWLCHMDRSDYSIESGLFFVYTSYLNMIGGICCEARCQHVFDKSHDFTFRERNYSIYYMDCVKCFWFRYGSRVPIHSFLLYIIYTNDL